MPKFYHTAPGDNKLQRHVSISENVQWKNNKSQHVYKCNYVKLSMTVPRERNLFLSPVLIDKIQDNFTVKFTQFNALKQFIDKTIKRVQSHTLFKLENSHFIQI